MPGSAPPLQVLFGKEVGQSWETSVPGGTGSALSVKVVPQSLWKVRFCGIGSTPEQSTNRSRFTRYWSPPKHW